MHNEQALQLKMHNFKAEFIDPAVEKMMREIARKHEDQVKKTQEAFEKHAKS